MLKKKGPPVCIGGPFSLLVVPTGLVGVELIEGQREARHEHIDKVAHGRVHAGGQHLLEALARGLELPVADAQFLQTLGIGAEGVGILHQPGQGVVLGT